MNVDITRARRTNLYNRKVAGLILLGLALIPLVGAAILHGTQIIGLRIILILFGVVLVVLGVFFMYSVTSLDG